MNDGLRPLPRRAKGPSNVVGVPPISDSSVGSFDPDMTQERNELAARLEATIVTLHAAEEETIATQAMLAEADAIVAGEALPIL